MQRLFADTAYRTKLAYIEDNKNGPTASEGCGSWAQANGVHPVTFGSWVERYDRERAQTQTKPFLPVTVTPQELPAVAFTVRLAGHTLTFDTPPPPAWLAALLHELTPC